MKSWTAAFIAHMSGAYQTITTCWLSKRVDGTFLAVTAAALDIPFDLEAALTAQSIPVPPWIVGTGSRTYAALSGFTGSDIATNAGMNVDTGEAQGVLVSPSITEADMLAGLWDYAAMIVFEVNYRDLSTTMGCNVERVGHIGEVMTPSPGTFRAAWRGLMEAYQSNVGELTGPRCRANLGDARCRKDLATFTKTGAITTVGADGVTLYDTARTEPGPTAGVALVSVTNADPGHAVMAGPGTFANNDPISITNARGMVLINTTTFMRNLSGSEFDLPINTSDTGFYGVYTGGGIVSPIGGGAGFFGFGIIAMLTGPNAGLSMEVKTSNVGVWTLQLPFPTLCTVGDTYRMIAGCDKSLATCRDTFDNVNNRRAEDWIPGWDKMVQVGRPQ